MVLSALRVILAAARQLDRALRIGPGFPNGGFGPVPRRAGVPLRPVLLEVRLDFLEATALIAGIGTPLLGVAAIDV
jgi:hypothetical protein